MIESDTIKLLRECDAGIKMGVSSLDEVLDYVHDEKLEEALKEYREEHNELQSEILTLLEKYQDDGKEPNPIAKSMSWVKTNAKLVMDESDHTIADLVTDGCNMGVKSLNRYLNQYKAADGGKADSRGSEVSMILSRICLITYFRKVRQSGSAAERKALPYFSLQRRPG